MTLPLCQQCGKKLQKIYYNCRGHFSTAIISSEPEQKRDALFHSQYCFYEWVQDHRDDLERMIRSRGEWKS